LKKIHKKNKIKKLKLFKKNEESFINY